MAGGATGTLGSSDGDGEGLGIGTRGGTDALDATGTIGGADVDGAAAAGSATNESLRFNFSGAGSPPPTSPFAATGTAGTTGAAGGTNGTDAATGGGGITTGATAGSE